MHIYIIDIISFYRLISRLSVCAVFVSDFASSSVLLISFYITRRFAIFLINFFINFDESLSYNLLWGRATNPSS